MLAFSSYGFLGGQKGGLTTLLENVTKASTMVDVVFIKAHPQWSQDHLQGRLRVPTLSASSKLLQSCCKASLVQGGRIPADPPPKKKQEEERKNKKNHQKSHVLASGPL